MTEIKTVGKALDQQAIADENRRKNSPTRQEQFYAGLGSRPISMWPRKWRAIREKSACIASKIGEK